MTRIEIVILIIVLIVIYVTYNLVKTKYLYVNIIYRNGDEEEFGPFLTEDDFFQWLNSHSDIYDIKSYSLEYRSDNINQNLT